MKLSIRAVDFFRVLEIKRVVNDKDFARSLYDGFDDFFLGVSQTRGLKKDSNTSYKRNEPKNSDVKKYDQLRKMNENKLYAIFADALKDDKKGPLGKILNRKMKLEREQGKGEEVDLLSFYSAKESSVYVIEVKACGSRESPLRAMYEALTCWLELIDDKRRNEQLEKGDCLKGNAKEFIEKYMEDNPGSDFKVEPKEVCLRPAILLYKGSKKGKTYQNASTTYKDLCAPPEDAYKELYERILKYVKCFSYEGGTPDSLEIHPFDPLEEWKNPKPSRTRR